MEVTTMTDELKVHDSTGNVFHDMGMRDAEERLAKAELATLLGIQQPDVSDLPRGKLARFSITRLERFLNALDLEIRIQVGPRPPGKARAGFTVETLEP